MAQHEQNPAPVEDSGDGAADSLAAIAIIALVVGAVTFWLKSMHM